MSGGVTGANSLTIENVNTDSVTFSTGSINNAGTLTMTSGGTLLSVRLD